MLSKPRHVGVLIGSLRRDSFSRKLAKALIARAPATLDCHIIEIGDLPLYNEDLDSSPPPAWVSFRAALESCDALLFVTPEYNRSIPGCLKNATDIGSRQLRITEVSRIERGEWKLVHRHADMGKAK